MLASLFELIFLYITLSKMEGKPPSMYRLAKYMNVKESCILHRKRLAAELGLIVEPPKKRDRNPEWCVLTDVGANLFIQVLDRRTKLIWSDIIAICKDRKLFPKDLIYVMLPEGKYRTYVKALKSGAATVQY